MKQLYKEKETGARHAYEKAHQDVEKAKAAFESEL
jgi:hypothetical protein